MMDTQTPTAQFDQDLDALFSRVSNFIIRCKSDIEAVTPFQGGTGRFVYKRGFELDKEFAVSARPDAEKKNLVHVKVEAGAGRSIELPFDMAPDAFVKKDQAVSTASTRSLDMFMATLR